MLDYHPRRAPRRVILQPRALLLQHGLQLREHGVEMLVHLLLIIRRCDKQPHRKHRVRLSPGVFIIEAVHEDFEQAGGILRHSGVHGADAFGEDADGGGALEGLGDGRETEEGFLDHFVELGEGRAEDVGEGDEHVERGVDNEPVVFGGLEGAGVEVFVRGGAAVGGDGGEVDLAGVFAGQEL